MIRVFRCSGDGFFTHEPYECSVKQLSSSRKGLRLVKVLIPARQTKARLGAGHTCNGTANMFLQVKPLVGKPSVRVTDRRANADFALELRHFVEVE